MNYIKTEIDGVFIIEPKVFNDSRGYLFEAFKYSDFKEHVGRFHLFKIMNPNRLMASCVACIIRRGISHRLN